MNDAYEAVMEDRDEDFVSFEGDTKAVAEEVFKAAIGGGVTKDEVFTAVIAKFPR